MPARSVCGLTNPWMFSILLSGFIKYNLLPQFPWEGRGREERLTSPVFWQQKSTIRMHRELIFKNNTFQRKSPRAAWAVCCVSWSAAEELCRRGWASVVSPAVLLGRTAPAWLLRAAPSLSDGFFSSTSFQNWLYKAVESIFPFLSPNAVFLCCLNRSKDWLLPCQVGAAQGIFFFFFFKENLMQIGRCHSRSVTSPGHVSVRKRY